MTLAKSDREYLRNECNEDEQSIDQIEAAINKTTWSRDGKILSATTVIRTLGRERFLQGMRRSAFHRDSHVFIGDTDETIYFDSYKFFKR